MEPDPVVVLPKMDEVAVAADVLGAPPPPPKIEPELVEAPPNTEAVPADVAGVAPPKTEDVPAVVLAVAPPKTEVVPAAVLGVAPPNTEAVPEEVLGVAPPKMEPEVVFGLPNMDDVAVVAAVLEPTKARG